MEPLYQIANVQPSSLSTASPERINAQKASRLYNEATDSPRGKQRSERNVHEKVTAFNKLNLQARHLERKTHDAALKRANLGREEAECEMRHFREEARKLRKALDESKRRELIVGERLETVMENFGRSRESFESAKVAWDKEIRRARKESFKTQSAFLKAQDELKSCRMAVRVAKSDLEIEKARSSVREQEAFQTRLQLGQVQEEQSHLQKQLQLVEQERDVLRKIVEKKQIARAASEGCIPLPISDEDDEFASPKKRCLTVGPIAILRSAASEGELEELRMELNWEKQRACRAFDRIEFLETECKLQCCASRIAARTAIQTNENLCLDKDGLSDENNSLELHESLENNLTPDVNPLLHCTSQIPNDRSYARTPSCDPPESIHEMYKTGTPPPCSDTLEELASG